MAEDLAKEKNKSNGRNSSGKRTSFDGGQSILPHFRTSFASCNVVGTTKPRRNSISTVKPISSTNAKPKSSENGGSNLRRNILPHYRTPFATCNSGEGISKINSTKKPSSSSSSSNEGGNSRRNSISERKPSSSNLRASILPHYRTSFMTCNVGANPRINSTGKQTSSLNNNANLPLHLRASNGSCHDSCKYGLQDGNEEKPRVSITKRNNVPPPSPNQNHNRRIISQDERKKPISFKPKYSSDSEIRSPKQEVLILCKRRSCSVKSRPTMEKPYASPDVSKRLIAKGNRKFDTMASPRNSVAQSKSLNLSKCKSLNLNSPPRPQMIKQKSQTIRSNPKKAENENRGLESAQNEIFIESPPPKSSSSHSNSLVFSSEDDLSEFSEFEYEYTDDESDNYESEYTDEEIISETNEIIVLEKTETGPNCKRTKGRIIQYKDEDSAAPIKLKFRRGKVVETEKDNNENGPKRLRFRRGRTLESKEEGEVNGTTRRRIYKRVVDRVTKHATSPKAEKVELKHQDMEEKKDQQGLLNDVIEETATKLVEERKSKVKALVGAFETVFSTTDSAPNTPTSA